MFCRELLTSVLLSYYACCCSVVLTTNIRDEILCQMNGVSFIQRSHIKDFLYFQFDGKSILMICVIQIKEYTCRRMCVALLSQMNCSLSWKYFGCGTTPLSSDHLVVSFILLCTVLTDVCTVTLSTVFSLFIVASFPHSIPVFFYLNITGLSVLLLVYPSSVISYDFYSVIFLYHSFVLYIHSPFHINKLIMPPCNF